MQPTRPQIEPLFFIAEETGEFHLAIGSFEPLSEYEARLSPISRRTQRDRQATKAHSSFYAARMWRRTDPKLAIENYRHATELWETLEAKSQAARAHYELGEVLPRDRASLEDRFDAYQRARRLFAQVEDHRQEARCFHRMGGIAVRRGEIEASHSFFSSSLALWRQVGDLHEVAIVAYDLANVARRLGRPEEARSLFHEALELSHHNQRPLIHEAAIRTQLGALYIYRGETTRGIREYRVALRILDQHPRAQQKRILRHRARTLTRLGSALPASPDATSETLEEAHAHLDEARQLREELGEIRGIATTANSLGLLYEKMNKPRLALAAYRQAEGIFREQGPASDSAVVQGNRCRIVERLGNLEIARECYVEALGGLRRVGYRKAEAQTLWDLARNAQRRGELHEAQSWIHASLEVLELIRGQSDRSDLRSSFLDRKYDVYQSAIDITLELHEREPEAGHSDVAFHTLETARARGLLENLARYRPELETPLQLRKLRAAIYQAKVERLAMEDVATDKLEALELELESLLEELHRTKPSYAFVKPKILSVGEVQALLDPQTLLLEYHLGEPRSAVWAITDSRVVWRALPSRQVIEKTARELHEAMGSGGHKIKTWAFHRLSRELSEMVLKPVVDLLDRPQLAIVPAGALHYIPFAALPHPTSPVAAGRASETSSGHPEPLLLSHQITSTPSASVLAALRSRRARRTPAESLLALVAAPILRTDDDRLGGRASRAEVEATRPTKLTVPLRHTKKEAEAILTLAEGGDARSAIGFEANREFVLGGGLEDARMVHFATHGHLDDARGELSGLVLSQFDRTGRRIDGYLWAYEIFQLRLNADLVVLSACETALGEEIRGEGLVGLTNGFLYAGASRIVVSLWKVSDKATARLMEHFYHGLLRRGLQPAEALRQAQIELRAKGFTAPYYWAPFILQGDWSTKPPA